jgi:hypothetical protein
LAAADGLLKAALCAAANLARGANVVAQLVLVAVFHALAAIRLIAPLRCSRRML